MITGMEDLSRAFIKRDYGVGAGIPDLLTAVEATIAKLSAGANVVKYEIDVSHHPLAIREKSKEIDSGVEKWEAPAPIVAHPADERELKPIHKYIKALYQWQKYLPGNFCIFIGNLPFQYDDASMSQSLMKQFSVYGVCTAAVRRENRMAPAAETNGFGPGVDKRIPYGHVQFDNFGAALSAVNKLAGPHLLGDRLLRIEFNKARRTMIVYTFQPVVPNFDYVLAHLSRWGRILSIRATTKRMRAAGRPIGAVVEFETVKQLRNMNRHVGWYDNCYCYMF